MTKLEANCKVLDIHAPIIRAFGDYCILAQDEKDLKRKIANINLGDTKGFLTLDFIEREVAKIKSNQ